MIYYNSKRDILGELTWRIQPNIALIQISEDTEFIPFTFDWELVGIL